MKRKILQFMIFIILMCAVFAKHHKHHHHHHHHHSQRQRNHINQQNEHPYLNIDAFGNCHNADRQLSGRCIRFQSCHSAVRAWQTQQMQPLSCYFTTYENFVCCPDEPHYTNGFWTPAPPIQPYSPYSPHFPLYTPQPLPLPPTIPNVAPVLPTLSSHLPLQSPPPLSVEFLNRARENKELTLSEQECQNIYFPRSDKRRKHRGRRDLDAEKDESKDVGNVVEEMIDRESQIQLEAVGGIATEFDEFPYMCALGWKSSLSRSKINYNCGCVLIAKRYVLTAAHCAILGGESPTVVRLGGVDLNETHAEVLKIKKITQHPEYFDDSAYNDIAIIKLEKGSRNTPACIWSIESLPEQRLTAIGYGQTQFAGPSSNSLLKVFLNIISNQECSSFYKPRDKLLHGIGAGQICAGDPQNQMDTCQGDSGGPLLLKVAIQNVLVPYIVGLTSFGEGCASGTPSVYTRISAYTDWIESEVWK